MSLEIRLHGRGGQGGVTCAKILAATYARLGKSVQTFGDYAGERSGAPVRAYTRVSDTPIDNRNKIYFPDHLLVLDPTLLDDAAVSGLRAGGLLVVNTAERPDALEARLGGFHVAAVDATAIARARGIGSRSVVIVNTTLAGAYVRAAGLPFEALEGAYRDLHLERDLPAAREAYENVVCGGWAMLARAAEAAREECTALASTDGAGPANVVASGAEPANQPGPPVIPLTEHVEGPRPALKTGSWRTQIPRYVELVAPCGAACPAGNDVVGFVQALHERGESAAAEILARTQPLASICGRVCPAPCMAACNRREYDGAVNVRGLERWVGDLAGPSIARVATPAIPRHVAVVGSGPAGLAATWELARAGHLVTLYEGEHELGGVLRTGIPAYRLPRIVIDREIDAIIALGVEVRKGEFLDAVRIRELQKEHDAVILAAGLARPADLDVAGAKLKGIEQGVAFLHRVNMEGGAKLAGHVMVLGGGNTAMDCARSAIRSGASIVTVAYRRTRAEMPALPEEIVEAEREGISFLFLRQPVAFHGRRRLAEVELAEVELGAPDASGRRRPIVTNHSARFECDYALLAMGQGADRTLLPRTAKVAGGRLQAAYGDSGRLQAASSETNLFVAGDFATGEGTVAHAIGDGRRAAMRALHALGEPVLPWAPPDRNRVVPAARMRFDYFPKSAPAESPEMAALDRTGFDETNFGLSNASEASRCLSCGHCNHCDTCLVYCPEGAIDRTEGGYLVAMDYCKGCGICAAECPRDGMEMVPA